MTPSLSAPPRDARFFRTHLVYPALAWIVFTVLWELSGLDLVLLDLVANGTQGFPLEKNWILKDLSHEGGKYLMLATGLVGVAAFLLSFRVPRLAPYRREILYFVVVLATATLIVSTLKKISNRHCPWDIDRWGGPVPYTTLFEPEPPGFGHGHGFPAGHVAGPLSLVSLYFIARERGRRAWPWLAPAALLGLVYAATQHWRGAHYPSHNLWSLAICWLVALAWLPALRGTKPRAARSAGPAP